MIDVVKLAKLIERLEWCADHSGETISTCCKEAVSALRERVAEAEDLVDALERARPYVQWCLQNAFTSPSAQYDLQVIDTALQKAKQSEYDAAMDCHAGRLHK